MKLFGIQKTIFAAVLALLASLSFGQAGTMHPGPSSGTAVMIPYFLMTHGDVQKELGLTTQQIQAYRQKIDEVHATMKMAIAQEATHEQVLAAVNSVGEWVHATLTGAQLNRLGQLVLQAQGPTAMLNASTAKQVGLSAEQNARLATINAGWQDAVNEMQPASGTYTDQYWQAKATLDQDRDKQILALLTPSQVGVWKKMLANPSSLSIRLTAAR